MLVGGNEGDSRGNYCPLNGAKLTVLGRILQE
jgi:hypothetical protein